MKIQPNKSLPPSSLGGQKERVQKDLEWVEVIPHGLVGGMAANLCLMVFKEKHGSKRFAVSLPPLQGKIALNQSLNREEPFRFVSELFNTLQIRIKKCYFRKNYRGSIGAELLLSGSAVGRRSIKLMAGDVIPFAVYAGCRFYCTKKFMNEMLDQKIDHMLQKSAVIRKPLYLN